MLEPKLYAFAACVVWGLPTLHWFTLAGIRNDREGITWTNSQELKDRTCSFTFGVQRRWRTNSIRAPSLHRHKLQIAPLRSG